jgi:2'-5' RNA ligase
MDLLLQEAKAFHPHVTVAKDDMRMTIEGGGLNERV